MKLSQLVLIALVGILFSMCGKSDTEKEITQATPTFAHYVSKGTPDEITIPANNREEDPNKIILHEKKDELSGFTVYQIPLPANWKLTSNGMVGPDGTIVEKTDLRVLDLRFSTIKCIDELVKDEIIPGLFREGKKVNQVVNLPGIARNNQRSYAMFCDPLTAKTAHEVKGIEFTDPQGNKGMAIVQSMLTKTDHSETLRYKVSILTARADQFNQAKSDLIFGMRNKRMNPEFVTYKNFQASQVTQNEDPSKTQFDGSVQANGYQVGGRDSTPRDGQQFQEWTAHTDHNQVRNTGFPVRGNNEIIINESSSGNANYYHETSQFKDDMEIYEGDLDLRAQIRQELFGGRFEDGQTGMTYEESQYIDQMVEQEYQRRKAAINQDSEQAQSDMSLSNNWMYQ